MASAERRPPATTTIVRFQRAASCLLMRQSVGEHLIWVDWNAGPTSEDETKAVEEGERDDGDGEEEGS